MQSKFNISLKITSVIMLNLCIYNISPQTYAGIFLSAVVQHAIPQNTFRFYNIWCNPLKVTTPFLLKNKDII